MDFGALQPQTPFDETLVPASAASFLWLKKLNEFESIEPHFDIGLPQWTIPGFSKTLPVYAQTFRSIELNSSFYKIPSREQVLRWKEQAGAGFRFFVKIHQSLSHDRFLWTQPEILGVQIGQFLEVWNHLDDSLGGYFLQLPPQITIQDLKLIETWLRIFRSQSESDLQIELRHESWFLDRQIASSAARVFAQQNVGVVCSDTPGRRDASHTTLTSASWMIRFLGQSTEMHDQPLDQDLRRIGLWAEHLKELQKNGLRKIAFFIHTPDHFWAPTLANVWSELWGMGPLLNAKEASPPPPQLDLL